MNEIIFIVEEAPEGGRSGRGPRVHRHGDGQPAGPSYRRSRCGPLSLRGWVAARPHPVAQVQHITGADGRRSRSIVAPGALSPLRKVGVTAAGQIQTGGDPKNRGGSGQALADLRPFR